MRFLAGYFHGNTVKNCSTDNIKLSETTYASALKLKPHSHEAAYFCYVLQGNFTEGYGSRKSRFCRKASLIFHPADETHSDYFHSNARCFNIQLNGGWLDRVRGGSKIINAPADFLDSHLSFLAARLYGEFLEFDEFSSLVVEGLTIELLARVSRLCSYQKSKTSPPYWLRQTREILDERSAENLTLARLSETVGVHPTHIAREFRRFYHCSVGEYVRRRRVEIASQQISKTDAPFAEIALAAGFFDQSHLTRTLKKLTGMTPSEHRAACRLRRC